MAFRLHDQLLRGEIDNRTRGRVTGTLWFINRPEPVTLELEGNCVYLEWFYSHSIVAGGFELMS
jgi:hypothetical protein